MTLENSVAENNIRWTISIDYNLCWIIYIFRLPIVDFLQNSKNSYDGCTCVLIVTLIVS